MATYLHRDTQWPCPDGYHVPTNTDWRAVYGVWTKLWLRSNSNWNWMKTYLKLPFAWYRAWNTWWTVSQGTTWRYWSSSVGTEAISAYWPYIEASSINISQLHVRAFWLTIRPFKNLPVTPEWSWWVSLYKWTWNEWIFHNSTEWIISLSSDWITRYTIADKNLWATTVYNDWNTLSEANCWKYYQWWNNYGFSFTWTLDASSTKVNASGYWPWNYYNVNNFIYNSSDWSSVQNDNLRWWVTDERPFPLRIIKKFYHMWVEYKIKGGKPTPSTYTPWIYHNASLGLISLSSDGSEWITMADKNLGATTVYNDGATLSEANCWKFFQWWNNYGFPYTWATTVSQNTSVNASSYWPGNYYSNSTFRWWTNDGHWDSSLNNNLWWGTTNTYEARQWPCGNWRHIPSYNDLIAVTNIAWNSKSDTPSRLKLAPSWYLQWYDWTIVEKWTTNWYILWSSDWVTWWERATWWQLWNTIQPPSWTLWSVKKAWYVIRPFANTPVVPDSSWTALYQ